MNGDERFRRVIGVLVEKLGGSVVVSDFELASIDDSTISIQENLF